MSPLPTPFNRQDVDWFQLHVGTEIASADQTGMLISMGSWRARN